MSATVVISCDGSWDAGRMPCRAAMPTSTGDLDDATDQALTAGWSTALLETGGGEHELHYCPAHTRLGLAS